MSAPEWELRTSCPSCHILVRLPIAIAGQTRPCPACGAAVRAEGERVPIERATFSEEERERAEEEVEPTGLAGWLFGGGLAAGVAAIGLSTVTHGRFSALLLWSGLAMVGTWIVTRRLPPRAP